MNAWTAEEIVNRLDEWSGGLPNGDHKFILVAAADKIEELEQTINRLRLEKDQIDWLRLKVQ
jgi:hypothetical protein